MPGPDWLQFKHAMDISRGDIIHSPKGTFWKDHKYTRKYVNHKGNTVYVYEGETSDGTSITAMYAEKGLLDRLKNKAEPKLREWQDKVANALYKLGTPKKIGTKTTEGSNWVKHEAIYDEEKLYHKGANALAKLIDSIGRKKR